MKMAKVKLTQKQADEIERIKRIGFPGHWKEDGWFIERDEKINDLSFHQLTNAVFNGYEVEPEFKSGDWVFNKKNNRTAKINLFGVDEVGARVDDFEFNNIYQLDEIRHATPQEIAEEKERRWWAKHNRDVLGFKENDIVKYDCTSWGGVCRVISNQYSMDAFGKRLIELYNWTSGRIITVRAESLEVICFAEDRQDA